MRTNGNKPRPEELEGLEKLVVGDRRKSSAYMHFATVGSSGCHLGLHAASLLGPRWAKRGKENECRIAWLDDASRPAKRLKAYSSVVCYAPIKTVEVKDTAGDNPTEGGSRACPSTTVVGVEGREIRLGLQYSCQPIVTLVGSWEQEELTTVAYEAGRAASRLSRPRDAAGSNG